MSKRVVYTLGYGGRSLEEFIGLIRGYRIERVVDVRRWVKSLKFPEYSGKNLSYKLMSMGIDYMWIPELGGYRRFSVDVRDYGIATCFKSQGFRAYATYITRSPSAKPHLEKLVRLVSEKTSVLVCRERIPWRCHRKILSDYLVAKGFKVIHILDPGKTVEHKLSKCAIVVDGELDYK
ncbi:MAG: DUF488 family protein [Thermoprotei archaeon]